MYACEITPEALDTYRVHIALFLSLNQRVQAKSYFAKFQDKAISVKHPEWFNANRDWINATRATLYPQEAPAAAAPSKVEVIAPKPTAVVPERQATKEASPSKAKQSSPLAEGSGPSLQAEPSQERNYCNEVAAAVSVVALVVLFTFF